MEHTRTQIAADEMKNIASIVTGDKAAIDKAFGEGLYIATERYVLAKVEDGSVYARKVRGRPRKSRAAGQAHKPARQRLLTSDFQGKEGISIAKSKQAILIGHHGEQGVAGSTTQAVESLKDYLVGQGY